MVVGGGGAVEWVDSLLQFTTFVNMSFLRRYISSIGIPPIKLGSDSVYEILSMDIYTGFPEPSSA